VIVVGVLGKDADRGIAGLVPDGEAVGMIQHFTVASPIDVQNPGTPSHFVCWSAAQAPAIKRHMLPLEEAPHAYEIFQKKQDGAGKVI